MSLTDTQLVILSKAAQREDRAVELPPHLKGGAARKVVEKLLASGQLEELQTRGSLPAWRRDGANVPMALRITKRGLKAIRVEEPEGSAKPASALPAATNTTKRRPKKEPPRLLPADSPAGKKSSGRQGSKQERVLGMLRLPKGTTIAAVIEATGWQAHSVRGFFSGVVRKKLGLDVASEQEGDARIYRIVEA